MTQQETARIIGLLKEFFPQSSDNSTIENRVKAWHMILREYDFSATLKAVVSFAKNDTKGFFPSVGQIVNMLSPEDRDYFTALDSAYFERSMVYLVERRRMIE